MITELLLRDPVRNAVLLEELDSGGTPVVVRGGVAVAREPRGIRLGEITADAVPELVERLKAQAPESTRIEGAGEVAGAFATAWSVAVGKQAQEVGGVRLYRLGRLRVPDGAGVARRADRSDQDLCAGWLAAMAEEEAELRGWVVGGRSIDGPSERVRRLIDEGQLWVLTHDGQVVTMAAHWPVLHGVARIGPVYTPPEFRRRGYGAAVTGHLAQILQGQGAEVCLRTDLGNPYSHGVYQGIGFETVVDLRRFMVR